MYGSYMSPHKSESNTMRQAEQSRILLSNYNDTKRRLPDRPKTSSIHYTHDEQEKVRHRLNEHEKGSMYSRSISGNSRQHAREDVSIRENDNSTVFSQTHGSATKLMGHRKNQGIISNTYKAREEDIYHGNTYDDSTYGSHMRHTSTAQFPASYTPESESKDKHKTYDYHKQNSEIRQRGSSAKYHRETNGYDNSRADTDGKDCHTYSSQSRGSSADDVSFGRRLTSSKQYRDTYDPQKPSVEAKLKHASISNTSDHRGKQTHYSPDTDKSKSRIFMMDNTSKASSLYKTRDNITFEKQKQQSPTDTETYMRQDIDLGARNADFSVKSKTYSSPKRDHQHVNDYNINDNQAGTTKNSSSDYRFNDDEIPSLSYRENIGENGNQMEKMVDQPAYEMFKDKGKDKDAERYRNVYERLDNQDERRERMRENKHQKKTVVDRLIFDRHNIDKEKDREHERLKQMNEHLKPERQETERREKLRENEQQKKIVVDHPVSDAYNIDKDREIEKLKRMNERLKLEKEEIERRSNEVTKQLSRQMKHSNHFENCNDDLSSSRVAEKFKLLYDVKWVRLCKWMCQTLHKAPEVKIIQYLSCLMKSCHKECLNMADNQIRQFLILGETDAIPKPEEHPELFELRKQYAQSDGIRKKVRKIIKEKVHVKDKLSEFNLEISGSDVLEKVESFLKEFIDTCWLMTVSEPAIVLNFDVVGKMYSDYVDHFSVYSLKKPVDDPTRTEGTVYEVVWPCVQLMFNSEMYKKGDVILIKKKTKDTSTQTQNSLLY